MSVRSNSDLILPDAHGFFPPHNYLINGGFELWQRNTAFSSTGGAGYYTADRWFLQNNGTTTQHTVAQSSGQTAHGTGLGSPFGGSLYAFGDTISSYNGITYLQQYIKETADLAALTGRHVVFAIDVLQTVANGVSIQLSTTGTGTGADAPINLNSATYGTSGTWSRLMIAGRIPQSTTQINVLVLFNSNGTYYLDNAVLSIGTRMPYYVPIPIVDDLARCQRYYEYIGVNGVSSQGYAPNTASTNFIGTVFSTSPWYNYVAFNTQKGGVPSVTPTNSSGWTVDKCGQPTVFGATQHGFAIVATGTTAGVYGTYQSTTGRYFTAEWNP